MAAALMFVSIRLVVVTIGFFALRMSIEDLFYFFSSV